MNTTHSITAVRGKLCGVSPVPTARRAPGSPPAAGKQFYRALLAAAALVLAAPEAPQMQWSGLGHGKRYLRINEYLFNGTQTVTAIAGCVGTDASESRPT